jgi:hypothetical protein
VKALTGLLASVGDMFGGGLVYDHGFTVQTAGDHPVWHRTETDVFPAGTTDEER